jgi:hypothetical protein
LKSLPNDLGPDAGPLLTDSQETDARLWELERMIDQEIHDIVQARRLIKALARALFQLRPG